MRVTVIEPNKIIYDKSAEKVLLPAFDGEMCVFDFHQSFVYRLKKGELIIDDSLLIRINEGMARMSGNELAIMILLQR